MDETGARASITSIFWFHCGRWIMAMKKRAQPSE
jgi:hypothetical protein